MLTKPTQAQNKQKKFNEQSYRKENFFCKAVTPPEVENLINCLDTNKAAGIDTIPPKLNKIAADFLTPLLTVAINKIIEQNVLPDSPKITSVIPFDKGNQIKMNFQIIDLLVF